MDERYWLWFFCLITVLAAVGTYLSHRPPPPDVYYQVNCFVVTGGDLIPTIQFKASNVRPFEDVLIFNEGVYKLGYNEACKIKEIQTP